MRTAEICPTCSTYINALCVIYNGLYLSTIDVEPMDSLEVALGKINAAFSTLQPSLGFTPENVVNKSPDNTLGGATPSDTLYPSQKAVKDYVDAQRPYKVYVALLSQSGINPPTAQVLENTLGGSVTYAYLFPGIYEVTLPSSVSGIWVSLTNNNVGSNGILEYETLGFPNNKFRLRTSEFTLGSPADINLADGVLNLTSIEIRIYP